MFITGGATHHRGLPADKHNFTELLAFDGDSWSVAGQMAEGCCYSAMAGLGDEIWVIGGGGGPSGHLRSTQIFDAATGARRDGVPLPSGRLGCIAATVDGRVYVIGGSGGFGG